MTSVLNLTWHGIGPTARATATQDDPTWVSTEAFGSVLDAVAARPDVRITFDDGNASDLFEALPRLLDRGLTAQFFVLAGRLGEPGHLDEAGVRTLAEAGMSIGTHGWAHRDWRRLRPGEAAEELHRSSTVLSEITGRRVQAAAIPFGSYDRNVLARLRATDLERVYTSDGGRTDPDRWLQSRFSLRRDTTPGDVRAMLERRPPLPNRALRAVVRWAKRNRP